MGQELLRFEDLSRQVAADARFYRMIGSTGEEAPAMLRGGFFIESFRSGLHIHATDAVEESDGQTELRLDPQISVSVVLEGEPAAEIDGRTLDLRVPDGAASGGLAWSIARPALLRRTIRKGQRIRKINISVDRVWVGDFFSAAPEQGAVLRDFAATHLALRQWYPSGATLEGARNLLACLSGDGLLDRLSLEMWALGILKDAFAQIEAGEDPGPEDLRAATLHRYIGENIRGDLSLASIASENGMSISTVQRVFKEAFGVTIIDHLRRARLQLAHLALTEERLPIQQAAHIAGYRSPANFATAYRREFGVAPSRALRVRGGS